ncbi:hypothetical protein TWF569_010380 [Orbilia oligospora]|nr:hypothetical protein TWF569_010380 [Orbilia oligospora]
MPLKDKGLSLERVPHIYPDTSAHQPSLNTYPQCKVYNIVTIKITKAVTIIIPPLTPDIISNRPTAAEPPLDGSAVSESVTLAVGSGKSTSKRVLEVGLSRIDSGGGVLDPPLGSAPFELGGSGPGVLVVGSASSSEVVGSDSAEVVVVNGEARRLNSLSASAEAVAEAETYVYQYFQVTVLVYVR